MTSVEDAEALGFTRGIMTAWKRAHLLAEMRGEEGKFEEGIALLELAAVLGNITEDALEDLDDAG
jgi:hypothetical protein